MSRKGSPTSTKVAGGFAGVGCLLLLLIPALLGYYFWKVKFEPRYAQYLQEQRQGAIQNPGPPASR